MITTWLFEFFHALRGAAAQQPQAIQDHYRWYLGLWTRAEQRGFDGIFFSEHHFGAGYAPSPNLLVANVAARTTRLRLGVLGVSTPYSSPWRVVEEFAMLDHLTGGRFEPGLVSGIPPELGFAGIAADVALARHEAIATAVEGFMRDGSVTAHGGGWSIDDLTIFPSMYQRPGHVWTACRSRATAEVAARRGWKVCTGFNSTESIADMFDGYRAAATEAGHPATADRLGLRRMVTFVDDASQQRAGVHAGKRHLLDVLNASAGPLPPFAALLDRPDETSSVLSDDEFVSGTPEQVAAELIRQCRAVGASNMLVAFGAIEPSQVEAAHQIFAERVLPALHEAEVVG